MIAAKRKRPQKILITAGPTREMLDPVRFITNLSTGEMGYAIAREAKRRGLAVTLISGPTGLMPPRGVRMVPIVTVEELGRALQKHFSGHDALIMSAAVGDFIPLRCASKKIPRMKRWNVSFRQAPDLVRRAARKKRGRIVVGFSLETGDWLGRSWKKLVRKHLDGIVANYYSPRHNPFGPTQVHAALLDRKETRVLRRPSKAALAREILDWIFRLSGI